jgi:hypothetical protein
VALSRETFKVSRVFKCMLFKYSEDEDEGACYSGLAVRLNIVSPGIVRFMVMHRYDPSIKMKGLGHSDFLGP